MSATGAELEQRMRLGHELTEELAELAMAALEETPMIAGFELVPDDAGSELGLHAGDIAFRDADTGLAWTVQVEVTCTPVDAAAALRAAAERAT